MALTNKNLRIYIRFDEYFNAEQLSSFLSVLDTLYNTLYLSFAPEEHLPLRPESRMRVTECRTGESILIELAEGIRLVWPTVGTTIQVTGTIGVTALMAHLIIRFAKGFAEFRKEWHEGTKAKYEGKLAKKKLEEEQKKHEECESETLSLHQIPESSRQSVSEATFRFLTLMEYAPNIVLVRVNGTTILHKNEIKDLPE